MWFWHVIYYLVLTMYRHLPLPLDPTLIIKCDDLPIRKMSGVQFHHTVQDQKAATEGNMLAG